MSEPKQLPTEVYPLPERYGFNLLHQPTDDDPCEPDSNGQCHNIDHLTALSKPKANA